MGILDERLRRGPAGWRQRLALIEASELSWLTQDRIGLDRLSLYIALRVSTVTDDAQALYRIGWTVRRLVGGPAPLMLQSGVAELETFLDRRSQPGQGERFEDAKAPSRVTEIAEHETFVCGVWPPPFTNRHDLRFHPCRIAGGEFLHGDYERVSHAFGR